MKIKVTKTDKSRRDGVDFDNLPFGKICSDHMFVMEYDDGKWSPGEVRPLTTFATHPANLTLHYGQSIFEGLKAFKQIDGSPVLFRIDAHARRFNESAKRMCMPLLPDGTFEEAVAELVKVDRDWIPPKEGSALYVRPFMYATEEFIGVRPSNKYRFLIFTCPVGPYYDRPVSLRAEDTYIRATPGGVGEAKTAGNYAASLLPAQLAQKAGYDQVMWMDPFQFKYIHEVGTMNIFFVIKHKIYTPDLSGCILKGITRDSVITLLKDQGMEVVEGPLSIKKVYKAYKKGNLKEAFGSGTAAVISPIERIGWRQREMELDPDTFIIAPSLKHAISQIRTGEAQDRFGWIKRV